MHFTLPFLLSLAAGTASASTWTVQAFTEANCKGTMKTWSGDTAGTTNTMDFYSSILAQYDSDWTFSTFTGAGGNSGEEYKPATNVCQNPTDESKQAILSFTLASVS